MKRLFIFSLTFLLSLSGVFADIEDNSIIDELGSKEVKALEADFKLKSFNSCNDMEKVMWDYIKDYWKNNKDKFYRWWRMYKTMGIMEDSIDMAVEESVAVPNEIGWSSSDDFSKTNTQVSWVDESDIIKTDWKYIYYFNDKDKYVYIVWVEDEKIVKKIKIPKTFSNPVLYLWDGTLTILSSWYSNYDYSKYWHWINRNAKTYVIVFDIQDVTSPKLEKLYITDWNLQKSRKIGDYLYVISNNSFNIPYYSYKTVGDIDLEISKIMPKKIDISKTSVTSEQNLKLKGKKLPYNVTSWNVAKCNNIEYVLPDPETLKKYDFNPSYNVISIIDTKNPSKEVKTKVIAWSNNEIYMSLDNLYLTSNMYQTYNFRCWISSRCFAPFYSRWVNTLLHKINVEWESLSYQDSTIIPWSPLTQYSMDEYAGNFRILTQTNSWNSKENESHTDLYILDKNLNLKWSLKNLWSWEQFKSSRYIGDKLFLVTFKQVDPLFAIDVADPSNPKILWELKIPWYSTYLHPYDENHLIGLWYDTSENKWWWTINDWLKVDLYEINYDKKCGDSDLSIEENKKCDSWDYKWIIVKQKYSKTLWQRWSYSEALNNPRMFMWNSNKKTLFLPVNLYNNDWNDIYRNTNFFQWLVSVIIDKNIGIKENYRITHLELKEAEKEREKECSKYTKEDTEKKCVKLINWEEYCESSRYNYVPKYCYADSPIWEYIASKSWNFRDNYIKRALWIWNQAFAVSNSNISSHELNTWNINFDIDFK